MYRNLLDGSWPACKLAIGTFMEKDMLNCRDKMESEFLGDAGVECNNVSVLSAMLRNMINMLPVHKTSITNTKICLHTKVQCHTHIKKYRLYVEHKFHTHKEYSLQPL